MSPHHCVVLGVDSGKAGGWSIYAAGKLVQFGELDGFDLEAVCKVVRAALQIAEIADMPAVLVIERPATYRGSGKRSFGTVLGMGATRGVWRAAWQSEGGATRRIVDAPIATWRSQVLGKGWGGRVTREQVRPVEQSMARFIVRSELGEEHAAKVGPDSAPAICIGRWGSHASQVAKRLPARSRAA
jgi:hypothetical protein